MQEYINIFRYFKISAKYESKICTQHMQFAQEKSSTHTVDEMSITARRSFFNMGGSRYRCESTNHNVIKIENCLSNNERLNF